MKMQIQAPAWASRPTTATARSACGTRPMPSDTTANGTAYQKLWYARRRRSALSQSSRPVSTSRRCAQTDIELILWEGSCEVHELFTAAQVQQARERRSEEHTSELQ